MYILYYSYCIYTFCIFLRLHWIHFCWPAFEIGSRGSTMCIRFNSSYFNYWIVNFVLFINRIYKGLYIVSSPPPSFQAGHLICEFHHSHYDLVQHWKWPSLSRNSLIASLSVLLLSHFCLFFLFIFVFVFYLSVHHHLWLWRSTSNRTMTAGQFSGRKRRAVHTRYIPDWGLCRKNKKHIIDQMGQI